MLRWLALAVTVTALAAAEPVPAWPSPLATRSAALFLVHPGGPLAARLAAQAPREIQRGLITIPPAVQAQLYDPEDRLVAHRYAKLGAERAELAFDLADAPAGVYQLRYAKWPDAMPLELAVTPGVKLGLMPCRCALREDRKGQFAERWLFVPPGAGPLKVASQGATVRLFDAAGQPAGEARTGELKPPGPVCRVRVAFDAPGTGVRLSGLPPILCEDEATARAIGGSQVTAPDGTPLAFRWQLDMWRWMHALKPEELAVAPADLTKLAAAWTGDPRNAGLLGPGGPFNHVPHILAHQDLDPRSPAYGLGANTAWLVPVYAIDEPFNPYRRNPAILKRIVLQEFARYLTLRENGTFNADNTDDYCGTDGLGTFPRHYAFGTLAPLADAAVRALWREGATRVLHRFALERVSCENQTSHWAEGLWLLYQGTGDATYRTMAHDFVAAMLDPELDPFMRAGYQQERYGPDATYNGLGACNLGLYYRMSGDTLVRDALQKTYTLFNHTVAPEPDGTLYGASSFSHRTNGSWVHRQWDAGMQYLAGELPEAGVWHPEREPEAWRKRATEAIAERLRTHWDDAWYETNQRWTEDYAVNPWTPFFSEYVYPPTALARGTWPVLAEERFTRQAADEFLFVRRPGYYTLVYTGHTSPDWVRAELKPVPLRPGWERVDGVLTPRTADAKKAGWRPTQGLGMVWTPAYGNGLLAANWNAYTAQLVRADLPGGTIAWPDYWSYRANWDAAANTLTAEQRLAGLPLSLRRTTSFTDEGIRQQLHLTATGEVAAERLVEQLPYLRKRGAVVRYRTAAGWSETGGPGCTDLWLGTADGPGLRITFAAPVTLVAGPSSRNEHELGLIEVELPRHLAAGGGADLDYTIRPTRWTP